MGYLEEVIERLQLVKKGYEDKDFLIYHYIEVLNEFYVSEILIDENEDAYSEANNIFNEYKEGNITVEEYCERILDILKEY